MTKDMKMFPISRWLVVALALALTLTFSVGTAAHADDRGTGHTLQDDPQPADDPADDPTDDPADDADVDQTDARSVVGAYAKSMNDGDYETMLKLMEPVDAPEDPNGSDNPDAVEPPEYPKVTWQLLDDEPWTSKDGNWMAYVIEMTMVAAEGQDPTTTKFPQWVMKTDDKWWIPTTSAGNAPMMEPSFTEWMMKLYR